MIDHLEIESTVLHKESEEGKAQMQREGANKMGESDRFHHDNHRFSCSLFCDHHHCHDDYINDCHCFHDDCVDDHDTWHKALPTFKGGRCSSGPAFTFFLI